MISPEYATHLAADGGRQVYTIQIGNGDEVDVQDGHRPLRAAASTSRHRFPVNPALLQKMAQETGGEAFIATDGKALEDSMHAVLDHLEKTRFEASIASTRTSSRSSSCPASASSRSTRSSAPGCSGGSRELRRAPGSSLGTALALLVGALLVLGGLRAERAPCARFGEPERVRALRHRRPGQAARVEGRAARARRWRSRSSRPRGRSTARARGSSRRRTSMWSSCSTTRRACTRATSSRRGSSAPRPRSRASSAISRARASARWRSPASRWASR